MPGYGLMSPARLKAAQARCRARQQALKQLATAGARRLLLRALARTESWTVEKALRRARLDLK
jgi:hypothetical protein